MSTPLAKRIDGPNGRYGCKFLLPPPAERPNPDTVASMPCRWALHLPRDHAFWADYSLCCCSLADFPGVQPAHKEYPEATHELQVFANDPARREGLWKNGSIAPLSPANYIVQFTVASDDEALLIMEEVATWLINGVPDGLPGEPQGITFNGVPYCDVAVERVREFASNLGEE
jgi:hypothetical protein